MDIETLATRRQIAQAMFAAKILKADIDCPALLAQLQFSVPARSLRPRDLMHRDFHRTDYGRHEPIAYMIESFLQAYSLFDFNESTTMFRRKLATNRPFDV